MIELGDVRAAAVRIEGRVRRTPLLAAAPMRRRLADGALLVLKLECLQVTGSFKARGAISKLGTLAEAEIRRGIVTASGGNHGAAVAYAGWVAGTPTTVFVPANVSPLKARKIESWGARLEVEGAVWDDSNRAALARAERDGLTYIHPFADPAVIAGQGTIALEILADAPEVETLIVAIGGGGLISGIAVAAKALRPGIRIVGVEPEGAPTLHASVQAGRVVELEAITTRVPTMAARRTEPVQPRTRAAPRRGDRAGERRRDAGRRPPAMAGARPRGRPLGRRRARAADHRQAPAAPGRTDLRPDLRCRCRRARVTPSPQEAVAVRAPPPSGPAVCRRENAYSSTARRVRMLSSAASTMRSELTASVIQSDRSRSSRIAFRKNACSRSQSSW